MRAFIVLIFISVLSSCTLFKHTSKNKKKATPVAAVIPKDSTHKPLVLPRKGPRPYSAVIKKQFHTQHGLFTVHEAHDTVYFEIPDSLMGRMLMAISRLKRAPGGLGAYAGEKLEEKTVYFEKGIGETIDLRYDLVISDADSTSAIYKAVQKSNLNPVVGSFPILAYGKDSASYVIDVSKFLVDKNFVNGISASKALSKVLDANTFKETAVSGVRVYPINVEIDLSKNGITKPSTDAPGKEPVTLESHLSLIELPKVPLQRQLFDPRVGYFADYYYEYGDHQQKTQVQQFILHWRLEPKPADRARWERGELVEPARPIVFYIDPATPKQWRKYLIMGINDWQAAFEQAGFKHAIIGKEWPEDDTTMHMEDARYSFVQYFPSEIRNAYGPQVHDPRSGEIIQSRIGWYHNVMQLLHDWYMIQAGAVDPRARKATFDEELMGQLIRFVSSHEVGHTLGLRHNFGSSSRTPVDSLRSKTWLQQHGHTASIMDYARFNYVAQPEDHLDEQELFPHIGEYDRWAIEWGYKYSGAPTVRADQLARNGWVTDSLAANPRLWFGDGETRKTDPRCQTEDLGDDAVKAGTYGIKNLQRILPQLPRWTHEPGGLYQGLDEMYTALQQQYTRYLSHVLKYVGGYYTTVRSEESAGDVYEPVSALKEEQALEFFNKQLFNTPRWLLNDSVMALVSEPAQPDFVEDLQVRMINTLLDVKQIDQVIAGSRRFGNQKALSADRYFSIVHKGVWHTLYGSGAVVLDAYQRNLQKSYLGALQAILTASEPATRETDVASLVRVEMVLLQNEIKQALPRSREPMTRYHLLDLQARIKKILEDKAG